MLEETYKQFNMIAISNLLTCLRVSQTTEMYWLECRTSNEVSSTQSADHLAWTANGQPKIVYQTNPIIQAPILAQVPNTNKLKTAPQTDFHTISKKANNRKVTTTVHRRLDVTDWSSHVKTLGWSRKQSTPILTWTTPASPNVN